MNGSCLLDTNIVIAFFAQDKAVLDRLTDTDMMYLPSIVVGELYYGARKSGRAQANIDRIERFLARNTILVIDAMTAQHYDLIKQAL